MSHRLLLLVMLLTSAAAVAGEAASVGQDEREAQFADLQRTCEAFRQNRWTPPAAQVFRPQSLILPSDRDPADVVLRRTAALAAHLRGMPGGPDLAAEQARLDELTGQAAAIGLQDGAARRRLFGEALDLRRRIAFANPLLDFGAILFVKRQFLPPAIERGNHMCDQYFGFHAIPGGGLFVLEKPFAAEPTVRDVLADAVCGNGRFKGKKLVPGGFLSPDLSYDGKTVLFAYTEAEPSRYVWTERSTFHIFKVSADGSGLVQLTDGPVNDFDPCWLPGGRIAFISERRGGYGRCHARPVPIFTLHAMNPDGSDIVCLSPNESNEWHPSVDSGGRIVYTRWDYLDRGHSQAHHPWVTTPDGGDARALQGNFGVSMTARPFMEMDVRAIPGSPRYVATAAAHHGQAYGSLVLIDPRVADDDAMAPLARLTPDVPFPEAERDGRPAYATAWPLSEEFCLCVHDPGAAAPRGPKNNFAVYLVDAWGNKELLYRDPSISCLSPMPLRPRWRPPIMPHAPAAGGPLPAGPDAAPDRPQAPPPLTAPVAVVSVYDALKPFPKGTAIKALRVVQVLPKSTPIHNEPRIGYGSEKSARAVLGTVPVEADGSAHFFLPVDRPVFFQALDERGMAVQSMRSTTYVHPGQRLVCQGCHEPRSRAAPLPERVPLALGRPPSAIAPDVAGSNPFSFPRLVQPVLDRHCVSCHGKEPTPPDLRAGDVKQNRYRWSTSYANLRTYAFYFGRFEAEYDPWTPPRTTPGEFGARASKLLAILEKGHYEVRLPAEDLHRVTLWLDSNSDFFGSYEDIEAQARGDVVRPRLE